MTRQATLHFDTDRRRDAYRMEFDAHPRHAFLATVMACPRCMGTFWTQMQRRRDLDAKGRA